MTEVYRRYSDRQAFGQTDMRCMVRDREGTQGGMLRASQAKPIRQMYTAYQIGLVHFMYPLDR